jgi:hypothetical protein
MIIRTATKWPMILAFRFLNWQVIDGRKPKSHQAIAIILPVLIAVGAKPVFGIVVPFVGETHGDAVAIVSPKLFDQSVVQLFGPFAFQKLNDFLSSFRELGAISPTGINGVSKGDPLRITSVPGVFRQSDFLNCTLLRERR